MGPTKVQYFICHVILVAWQLQVGRSSDLVTLKDSSETEPADVKSSVVRNRFGSIGRSGLPLQTSGSASDNTHVRIATANQLKNKKSPPVAAVINGTPVPKGVIPNLAVFLFAGLSFCGGTLVSPRHVLTAAHCFDWIESTEIPKIRVYLNTTTLVPLDSGTVVRAIQDIFIHPNYSAINSQNISRNDVAIILLDYDVLKIKPVKLANSTLVVAGREAIVYGFGINEVFVPENITSLPPGSNQLLSGSTRILLNTQCADLWSNDELVDVQYLCADGVQEACNGDSGGPVMVGNIQVGIVSFGRGGCNPQFPFVNARVASFTHWIGNILSSN